ncbi:MAG: hypothetical protein IJQ07_02425 [Clostridia bacterium]|nr:hypothetical protein [Clostridia bacterium]
MITTRRSNGLQTESTRGGLDLLEREAVNYEQTAPERVESMDEAKARMQRNLDKLLNYDRYSEMEAEKSAVIEDAPQIREAAYSDEDIRPTTTTTQFIDGDPQIFNDAAKSKSDEHVGYKLNAKGKVVVVLYALVVAVILALITLNTGVLRTLSADVNSLSATYAAKTAAIEQQNAIIAEISSPSHISEIAENQLGMVLGN